MRTATANIRTRQTKAWPTCLFIEPTTFREWVYGSYLLLKVAASCKKTE